MQFFEKVRVLDQARSDEYVGQVGIVIGIGEDEGHGASYSVSFPESDDVAMFWEYELSSTGVIADRSEVYGDDEVETIRVVVDPDGYGDIAPRPAGD
ncbi:hypothetical protein [Actinoplanes teichomyceticus]|uniref:Uncharacterized protein n=1 Tax=Actinoplanes teichomyceticus TaxID=1867 RepID=A0A561VKW9_ACTTI|nr:hypothetical protein [Actinoplanes teichomyceticus]TWG12251.1 hypothetical protein FHX34_105118 [Actinoplanes teichomyceticus]GIF14188.1 hypothetical protein Ate01nite_42200 [Actinoplanes teichomyceticus]